MKLYLTPFYIYIDDDGDDSDDDDDNGDSLVTRSQSVELLVFLFFPHLCTYCVFPVVLVYLLG